MFIIEALFFTGIIVAIVLIACAIGNTLAERRKKRYVAERAMRDALRHRNSEEVREVMVFHGEMLTKKERTYLAEREADFLIEEDVPDTKRSL